MALEDFVRHLQNLCANTAHGHPSHHKCVMLLAVFSSSTKDTFAEILASPRRLGMAHGAPVKRIIQCPPLPPGKILSVAAYPPPTWGHPYEDVHWDEPYFREVARRSDQMAVMMYDAAQRIPKTYQRLMADWTQEVLAWSDGKSVLLGVPTYDDTGVGYHRPEVENLTNALLGIHRGLSRQALPQNYQGIAIYSEWETSESEWRYFREHFLNQSKGPP